MEYRRSGPLAFAALAFALWLAPTAAADRPSPLLPVDKSNGEDEQIQKRIECSIGSPPGLSGQESRPTAPSSGS